MKHGVSNVEVLIQYQHEKAKRQKQSEVKINLYTDNKIDGFEIATKLRQQISKWQRAQSDAYLK